MAVVEGWGRGREVIVEAVVHCRGRPEDCSSASSFRIVIQGWRQGLGLREGLLGQIDMAWQVTVSQSSPLSLAVEVGVGREGRARSCRLTGMVTRSVDRGAVERVGAGAFVGRVDLPVGLLGLPHHLVVGGRGVGIGDSALRTGKKIL